MDKKILIFGDSISAGCNCSNGGWSGLLLKHTTEVRKNSDKWTIVKTERNFR